MADSLKGLFSDGGLLGDFLGGALVGILPVRAVTIVPHKGIPGYAHNGVTN